MTITRIGNYSFALLGLFFMSGTLSSFLTEPGATSAPLVQVLGGTIGFISVAALLLTRGSIAHILTVGWPALLPVGFTIASLIWSEDVGLSMRRAGALALTTAFAFWLVSRFTPKQIFGLLVGVAATIIVANFAAIQLSPSRGIHQVNDLIGEHHAGSWRGLFGHKNDFGRLVALSASISAIGFLFAAGGGRRHWLLVPVIALAALMIMRSNSSQALLLAASVPAITLVFLRMRYLTPSARSLVLMMSVPMALISIMSARLLFVYVLGLLGRDATLTGRTTIWEGVVLAMGHNTLLGGGYGAGWQIVGPRLTALTGIDVGHAHNGYLDLAVDIGFIGLGATIVFMAWLTIMAFRNLMQGRMVETSTVALAVLFFAFIGNLAGSFLLLHNSIYWVLLVVTFAILRENRNRILFDSKPRQSYGDLSDDDGMRIT